MAEVDDLAVLQDLDDCLTRDGARLREIRALLRDPEELLLAREQAAAAEAALAGLRRQVRELELEAASVRAKRQAGQDRLYSGKTTSTRELQGMEVEAEALARRLAQLEDETLELMLSVESASARQAEASGQVAALEATNRARVTALSAEGAALQHQVAQWQEQVKQARSALSPATLVRYDNIRARKAGKAVARLRRGVCLACGVEVPTHVVQRAQQRTAIVPCPSCARMLCPE